METAKVYISLPQAFLGKVDELAQLEHLSRSALIREALKLYMAQRSRALAMQEFQKQAALIRERYAHLADEDFASSLDELVKQSRKSPRKKR